MRRELKTSLLLFGAAVVFGCSSGPEVSPVSDLTASAATPIATKSTADPIQRGDMLEVFVREDASFNGEYLVREKGDIIIPEVGRIFVEGLTLDGAESRIGDSLRKGQLTSASVIVDRLNRASESVVEEKEDVTMIFLSGKVNRPGRHGVPMYQGRRPGIYEAILICGGLARFADDRKIRLLRPEGETGKKQEYVVNLDKIVKGESEDFPIMDGDILVVPEKTVSL